MKNWIVKVMNIEGQLMKMIQHKRNSTSCYCSLGRFAVGWFYGYAGEGWTACFAGSMAYYLRVWKFCLAWKYREERAGIQWCYCWPKGKIVR